MKSRCCFTSVSGKWSRLILASLLAGGAVWADDLELTYQSTWPGSLFSVAVSGHYAYVGDGGNLQVIDISNPASPRHVSGYATRDLAVAVTVAGNYAYVADAGAGLQVIDISNPASPRWVGGFNTTYAYGLTVARDYAYVLDWGVRLEVIDISKPASPRWIGAWDGSRYGRGVAVSGNYAYVADEAAGLLVIDVSNPAVPRGVGQYHTSGSALGVTLAGNYAYVADFDAGLQVIDISHPASPQRVGGFDTSGNARAVTVAGNYAYVADDSAGVQVIDVTNPANPRRVGGYDTSGHALSVAVLGSGVYVADAEGGLVILSLGRRVPLQVTVPRSPVVLPEGRKGALAARVSGQPAPQLQWLFNDAALSGATNAEFIVPSVTRAHEGVYALVASNSFESVVSGPIVAIVSNVDPERFVGLEWPGRADGELSLEFSDRLGAAAMWQTVNHYPPATTEQRFVELEVATARFYRLSASGSAPRFSGKGFVNGWPYTDAVGSKHRIECVAATTGWTNWQVLTELVLPASPYLFLDEASIGHPTRVYRSTPLP